MKLWYNQSVFHLHTNCVGNVHLNLSFSVTSVKNTNPSIVISMFCPTEYSISWYWPQWLGQEGIQAQPIRSYSGMLTEVTQKLEAILPKVTACLQNHTDKRTVPNIFVTALKKNLCSYCCQWQLCTRVCQLYVTTPLKSLAHLCFCCLPFKVQTNILE